MSAPVRGMLLRAAILVERAGEVVPLLAMARSGRGGPDLPVEVIKAIPPYDAVAWGDLDAAELRAIGEKLADDCAAQVAAIDALTPSARAFCARMGVSVEMLRASVARACGEAGTVRRVSMRGAS